MTKRKYLQGQRQNGQWYQPETHPGPARPPYPPPETPPRPRQIPGGDRFDRMRARFGLAGWSLVLLIPLVTLLVIFLVLIFIGRPYVVHGSSMLPTLNDGDRVFVVSYRQGTTPDRGDVVVLKNVTGTTDMLIKRVIARSGDRLTVGNGKIIVNGGDAYSSTINRNTDTYTEIVPDGSVFVMGDNERHSYDSRTFGPIPMDNVVGKALFIFWPVGNMKAL